MFDLPRDEGLLRPPHGSEDTYEQALQWLFAQSRAGQPRDPARMRYLMEALALSSPPQNVHVVGTSGKGSVSTMLATGLQASKQRSGRFISPHVEDFCERIWVSGRDIAAAQVQAFISRVQKLELNPSPAFFEWCLALALEHFAQEQVDIAVIEAGVGAKYDATMCVEPVVLVVITSIALDHVDVLGPTVRHIAQDKAAAIRPGVPVVTAACGEALEVLQQQAEACGSALFADDGQQPLFKPPAGSVARHSLHARNQRLATAALRTLGLSEAAVRQGVEAPSLAARVEHFHIQGRRVILDAAHNPLAAEALRQTLPEGFVLLFAALPRKLGEQTLAVLEPHAHSVFITHAGDAPSALTPQASRHYLPDPFEALAAALESCPDQGCLVITGSFYLAGYLRPWLRAHHQAR